jgi:hypothetical protein
MDQPLPEKATHVLTVAYVGGGPPVRYGYTPKPDDTGDVLTDQHPVLEIAYAHGGTLVVNRSHMLYYTTKALAQERAELEAHKVRYQAAVEKWTPV